MAASGSMRRQKTEEREHTISTDETISEDQQDHDCGMGVPSAFPCRLLIPFFARTYQHKTWENGQNNVAEDRCPSDGINKVGQICPCQQEGWNHDAKQDEKACVEIPFIF